MTATISTTSGNTTIDFSYTATTAMILAIVPAAANLLWNRGLGNHGGDDTPILFSSLTNQQKVNILDAYIRQGIIELANNFNQQAAADAATLAATKLNI